MTILAVGVGDPSRRAELVEAAGGRSVRTVERLDEITGPDDSVEALVGVTGRVDSVLALLPRLRWVHSGAAGVDGVLTPRLRDSAIEVTSATGNGAVPLAEHAAMLMLMLNRDAPRWARAQTEHHWDRFTHNELYGQTLGIIGLGHSGNHLAGIGAAFGMTVLGLTRRPRANPDAAVERVYPPTELHDFLSRCDVVVITVPATPETVGMFNAEALRRMRPNAHLICISRGGIIDEQALLTALDHGWIAGAGLDAHSIEPLPDDSPLWDRRDVIITPHNGATTVQTAERGWDILVDNVRRFATQQPLHNVVDKQAGY